MINKENEGSKDFVDIALHNVTPGVKVVGAVLGGIAKQLEPDAKFVAGRVVNKVITRTRKR